MGFFVPVLRHNQGVLNAAHLGEASQDSEILDIGCGTGGQTITLAKNTAVQITAIHMLPQMRLENFLNKAK